MVRVLKTFYFSSQHHVLFISLAIYLFCFCRFDTGFIFLFFKLIVDRFMVNFIIKSKPNVLNENLMLGPILFQNKANSKHFPKRSPKVTWFKK